jgi:hypothetical protein
MKTLTKLLSILLIWLSYACSSTYYTGYDDVYYSSKDKPVQSEKIQPKESNETNYNEYQEENNYSNEEDSSYYEPEYSTSETYNSPDGDTYITNNYYDDDYYDYQYASRLRRFHNPYYGFNYFGSLRFDKFNIIFNS